MSTVTKLKRGDTVLIASHNKGKVREFDEMFAPLGIKIIPAGSLGLAEPDETEHTFIGNAELKARAAAQMSELPVLADDSGIEIDILDGQPGIYAANWAGPTKDFSIAMQRVHDEVAAKGGWGLASGPKANFACALSLATPDGRMQSFEGKVDGHLVWPPRGLQGFGYDPMFVPDGHSLTFGEMTPVEKHAISHRTVAFAKLLAACVAG